MNLLLITLILLLALFSIKISHKSGIPSLILFLFLGMGFSYFGIDFNDFHIVDKISTLSLMVIMFYGGFSTNWTMCKKVAFKASILASFGVIGTSLLTGLFCYYILHFNFTESLLLGSIVGSTDYACVSNILISKKLNLKYSTAPLLEIESGSNDPTAYTLTVIFLSIMLGKNISVPLLIFKQVFFGVLIGFGVGFAFIKSLKIFKLNEDGLFSVYIAAIMLGTYGLCSIIQANGYLALYILGIYIGNVEYVGKKDVIFFYDGLTSLTQIALFFLLGLLSNVYEVIRYIPSGLLIMLFMLFFARPVVVFSLMKPFKLKNNQLALISIAGIRGAAAIAFSIMAVNTNLNFSIDIFHIVFVICLFSSLLQGLIMPLATKKLNMLDNSDTVLKTFNYYQDKTNLGFIETKILKNSKWIGKKLSDLQLAFNVIIAKIERGNKTIVPRGDTIILENDTLILAGQSHFDDTGINLVEITISSNHKWANMHLKNIDIDKNELIICLKDNNGQIIIPNGNTYLNINDRIILLKI